MIDTDSKYKEYDLPDYDLIRNNPEGKSFSLWHPDKTYIILGQSNKVETSVNTYAALIDNIDILKRPSGGEAVILSPKTIVVAFLNKREEYKKPLDFFKSSNKKIISALEKWPGINGIHQKGISDLSVDNTKIAGSAMYRSRDYLFYHAVINICEDISLINKYLLHPIREPDYRKGRNHSEFVTNIHNLGYKVEITELKKHFYDYFENSI